MIPETSDMMSISHARDLFNLFGCQFECEHPEVIAQSLLFGTGRDWDHILFDDPSQKDLAGIDGIFLGQ